MSTFSGPGDYFYLHPEYSTVLALSLLLSVLSILLAHGRNNEMGFFVAHFLDILQHALCVPTRK